MRTRVMLVRHGATILTAEDRFAGSVDIPLSETGEKQAEALASRMASERLDAVYASHQQRAVRTATIIAAPQGLSVQTDRAFREIDHGRWEQKTRAEVEREFKEEYQAWEDDPFTFAPEGGESGLAVLARALPALRALVQKHRGGTVLLVSHKATLRLLMGSLLGFDLRGYRDRLDQNPCCLNVLDFKDVHRARLMLYNDISHYSSQPRTPASALSKWWDGPVDAKG